MRRISTLSRTACSPSLYTVPAVELPAVLSLSEINLTEGSLEEAIVIAKSKTRLNSASELVLPRTISSPEREVGTRADFKG